VWEGDLQMKIFISNEDTTGDRLADWGLCPIRSFLDRTIDSGQAKEPFNARAIANAKIHSIG
jgi:hypothetical protein